MASRPTAGNRRRGPVTGRQIRNSRYGTPVARRRFARPRRASSTMYAKGPDGVPPGGARCRQVVQGIRAPESAGRGRSLRWLHPIGCPTRSIGTARSAKPPPTHTNNRDFSSRSLSGFAGAMSHPQGISALSHMPRRWQPDSMSSACPPPHDRAAQFEGERQSARHNGGATANSQRLLRAFTSSGPRGKQTSAARPKSRPSSTANRLRYSDCRSSQAQRSNFAAWTACSPNAQRPACAGREGRRSRTAASAPSMPLPRPDTACTHDRSSPGPDPAARK